MAAAAFPRSHSTLVRFEPCSVLVYDLVDTCYPVSVWVQPQAELPSPFSGLVSTPSPMGQVADGPQLPVGEENPIRNFTERYQKKMELALWLSRVGRGCFEAVQ